MKTGYIILLLLLLFIIMKSTYSNPADIVIPKPMSVAAPYIPRPHTENYRRKRSKKSNAIAETPIAAAEAPVKKYAEEPTLSTTKTATGQDFTFMPGTFLDAKNQIGLPGTVGGSRALASADERGYPLIIPKVQMPFLNSSVVHDPLQTTLTSKTFGV